MKIKADLGLPHADFVMYIVAGIRDTLRYVDSEHWCGSILEDIKQLREWCEQNDALDHLDIIDELARDIGDLMMEMAMAWLEFENTSAATNSERKSSNAIH